MLNKFDYQEKVVPVVDIPNYVFVTIVLQPQFFLKYDQ